MIGSLALSGLVLLVAASGWAGAKLSTRIFRALGGLAFLGYAFYLGFIFEGGEYRIFFYAFILPVALIVKMVKENSARKMREAEVEWAAGREAHQSSGSPSA